MALLGSLIWVVIGVVYVIYKAFQEERKATVTVLSIIIPFVGWLLIHGFFVKYIADKSGGLELFPAICVVIIPFILAIAVVILVINIIDKKNMQKNTPEAIERARNDSRRELISDFKRYGYDIANEALDELIADPLSPINYGNRKEVPLYECYIWMCKQYTTRINKLNDDGLSKEIGVPLESIPLNEELPKGRACLCRSLLAKNYILMKKGLKYYDFVDALQSQYSSTFLNEKSEYYKLFNRFIDKYLANNK